MTPTFYYRNDCHLCEALAAVLHRGWPQQAGQMEWRDVDERHEWQEAYGLKVPVLMLGDEEICALQPDLERISQYFGAATNPL